MKWIFWALLALLLGCDGLGNGTRSEPPTVEMVATAFGVGALTLEGTIELPLSSTSGRFIQLYLVRSSGTGGGAQYQGSVRTTSSHQVKYVITGLPSGDYKVRLSVDEGGNGLFSESGDYEGWYGGNYTAPVLSEGDATTVAMVSVSRANIDFAVGIVP